MSRRNRDFRRYANTSTAPQPATPSPGPGGGSMQPRPGPGPRGRLSSHPSPGGQLTSHPSQGGQLTPGPHPGISVHPGGNEIPFVPDNPQARLLYPEAFGEPGSIVNSPHCYLPNNDPNAIPMVDRGVPTSAYEKSVRLGFQPQPSNWGNMARGDAGMGQTAFRRTQLFAQLAPLGGNVADSVYSNAIGLATQTSSDTRLRNWHVSVFGIGTTLSAQVARGPLTSDQIFQNGGFWGNSGFGLAPTASPVPYVPQITSFKARAMIHDESGQRFFDFDVVGSRSFDVTAYTVSIFVLTPPGGFEVDPQNPSGVTADGILQDAIVGARIVPSVFEPVARKIKQTQSISLAIGGAAARMPIPPGAKTVQLFSQGTAIGALQYSIQFESVSPTDTDPSAAVPILGNIVIDPVTFRSDVIDVPNAASIAFRAIGGPPVPIPNSFIATFGVDP